MYMYNQPLTESQSLIQPLPEINENNVHYYFFSINWKLLQEAVKMDVW